MNKLDITTPQQAARYMINAGVVDMNNMLVSGEKLLEICGYDFSSRNLVKNIKRQIEKHGFFNGLDFTASMEGSNGGRPKTRYYFKLQAANHVLLAAMTEQGKKARNMAIEAVTEKASKPRALIIAEALLLAKDEIDELEAVVLKQSELIQDKNKPRSLSKIFGSNKLACAAHLILEDAGYIYKHYLTGSCGWALTDMGKAVGFGTQIAVHAILWTDGVLSLLPEPEEIVDTANELRV